MLWWTWVLLGFGLLAAEALSPAGFFIFFFGLAAMSVGALVWLEISGPPWMQWLLFSVLSVVSLLLLRPRLMGRFVANSGNTPMPDYVGEVAVLQSGLEPGSVAKAELRGTTWTVRSREPAPLAQGTRCIVERVEGLTLWVRPQ
jgi:membrane protein implicated in regulation of membrane protease activity